MKNKNAVFGLFAFLAVLSFGAVAIAGGFVVRAYIRSLPPPAITSDRELKTRAYGEVVTVRGRIGPMTTDLDDLLAMAPQNRDKPNPNVTPVAFLKLPDGQDVQCAFGEVSRNALAEWSRKNPPGTTVAIRGKLMGTVSGGHYFIIQCEIVPNGWN